MSQIVELEDRIKKIEARNREVEVNKAWETSWTRKFFIALFTYIAIAAYLGIVIGVNPWINAIVPTAGFLLSTLSLPIVRKYWQKYIYSKS